MLGNHVIDQRLKTGLRAAAAVAVCLLLLVFPVSGFAAGQTAVTVNADALYETGTHSLISVDPVDGARTLQDDLLPTVSDLAVATYGEFFYRIERFLSDNVTKFHVDAPDEDIWQFSTNDPTDEESGNPYALVFAGPDKAYLIRYGSTTVWIVNPSATTADAFKIGELDLSAYADGDGIPEMSSGVIVDGKLFVLMQRLEFWCPADGVYSYLAVFDTATDQEIDTGRGEEGLKGIPLPLFNVDSIQYVAARNTIYVSGTGSFGWCAGGPGGLGGIATVSPETYAADLILDGSEIERGNVSGMAIATSDKGYFIGYADWGDNTLYSFNPTTGALIGAVSEELQNLNILDMAVDENGLLWVLANDFAAGKVVIIDPADDTIDETVETNLFPQAIAFVSPEINIPPFKPELVSPANDTDAVSMQPTLTVGEFNDSNDGDSLLATRWQISSAADFSSLILDITSETSLTTLEPFGLKPDTEYFWRARFVDAAGAASVWSDSFSFTTVDQDPADADGNGIPDDQQVDDADNLLLADNPDLDAADLKTVQAAVGDIQMGLVGGDKVVSIDNLRAVDPADIDDDVNRPEEMPAGLFEFSITVENPGDTAMVTVYLSEAAAEDATWFKYSEKDGWEDYTEHVTFSDDRKSVTLELKDGGFGDADGVENGVILDPSGLAGAVAAADTDADTTSDSGSSGGGGGGGGCFIASLGGITAASSGSWAAIWLLIVGVITAGSRRFR